MILTGCYRQAGGFSSEIIKMERFGAVLVAGILLVLTLLVLTMLLSILQVLVLFGRILFSIVAGRHALQLLEGCMKTGQGIESHLQGDVENGFVGLLCQ